MTLGRGKKLRKNRGRGWGSNHRSSDLGLYLDIHLLTNDWVIFRGKIAIARGGAEMRVSVPIV